MRAAIFIREARLRGGLSQSELARRAGTSQPTVARYESGDVVPSITTLERLIHACGLALSVRLVARDPSYDDNIDSFRALSPQARIESVLNTAALGRELARAAQP